VLSSNPQGEKQTGDVFVPGDAQIPTHVVKYPCGPPPGEEQEFIEGPAS
jgi:hypothetical protein